MNYLVKSIYEMEEHIDAELNPSPDSQEQQRLGKYADIGLTYLVQSEVVNYTPEEERKVRWKIDLCLRPIVRLEP